MSPDVDPQILLIYRLSDVAGVLLMGMIGGTVARQRGYDIIGFFFIALFSALGGGMIRDVLINEGTVAAMAQREYLILAFTGAIIARFVYFKGRAWEIFQAHGDAVVSGLWAATGCVKALTFGLPAVACVMMGIFTAVGGGMIRDVVTGQVPGVFGDNQPTVIPAVVATSTVLISDQFGYLAVGMLLGPVLSIALSMYGYWAGWRISTDPDFAPVNEGAVQLASAAKKAEEKGRRVGRKLEPSRARAWRHQQMEKALQRRIDREVRRGKKPSQAESDAQDLLDEFTTEFEAVSSESEAARTTASGFGMDIGGDSYDDYDADAGGDRTAVAEDSGSMFDGQRFSQELVDMILADDKLTDDLLSRLEYKYREKNGEE